MSCLITKLALIDALFAVTGPDVYELEKVVFMFLFRANVKRCKIYRIRIVQVFYDHTANVLLYGKVIPFKLTITGILLLKIILSMKAIVLDEPGSVKNLIIREIPLPELKDNEVMIEVKAISINPVDVKTRNGNGIFKNPGFNKRLPLILGWDVSGIVTGSRSASFKAGDEVFGMINFPGAGRAYAEYVAAPADHITYKPAYISHGEAAAATLAPLTALQVLTQQMKIKQGDRVLIHAGSGGVGHYAIQIAKYYGAYVIATSSAANRDFILSLGADEHIDYTIQKLQEATHNIDFVLDTLGIESILNSLDIMNNGGKIISIVSQFTDEIKAKANIKNISGGFYLVQSNGNDMKLIADLMKAGNLKSHVSKIYSFDQISAAHVQIETGRTVGKVVVAF